jgi:hypothetical protein
MCTERKTTQKLVVPVPCRGRLKDDGTRHIPPKDDPVSLQLKKIRYAVVKRMLQNLQKNLIFPEKRLIDQQIFCILGD